VTLGRREREKGGGGRARDCCKGLLKGEKKRKGGKGVGVHSSFFRPCPPLLVGGKGGKGKGKKKGGGKETFPFLAGRLGGTAPGIPRKKGGGGDAGPSPSRTDFRSGSPPFFGGEGGGGKGGFGGHRYYCGKVRTIMYSKRRREIQIEEGEEKREGEPAG